MEEQALDKNGQPISVGDVIKANNWNYTVTKTRPNFVRVRSQMGTEIELRSNHVVIQTRKTTSGSQR